MDAGETLEAALHQVDAGGDGGDAVAFEEFVVDVVGDEGGGEFAEVLF